MRNLIIVLVIAGVMAGTAASITPEDLFGDVNYSYLDMTVPGFSSNTTFSMMDHFDNASMSFFSQFYFSSSSVSSSVSMTSGLSQPRRIEIRGHEPQLVYLFGAEPIPYREFVSRASLLGTNQLWIAGTDKWTQYVVCPVNTLLRLVADSTSDGVADIYEIYPNNTINRRQYPIFPGPNEMNFRADSVGRNIVFFIANSIPSNIVIIDVVPAVQTAPQQPVPQTPPTISAVSAVQVYTPPPAAVASSQAGDTVVIIRSTGMRGYDVYLDDVYVGTDGRGGDPLDGSFTLKVVGNMEHFIKVWDGQFFYGKPKYYPRGVTTTLWVEPGYALYI
ncbi:MAG: hypothetical protein QW781_04775 [Methanothrix sp.]